VALPHGCVLAASKWVKADRLQSSSRGGSLRWKQRYRLRGAVERRTAASSTSGRCPCGSGVGSGSSSTPT
jgi:hypothetical protein